MSDVSNLATAGRLPVIRGLIRRRLLVNFRVDEEVMEPPPFRPKLHRGYAIAGICLIRLRQIRPLWLPRFCGISVENAAHRIAVLWDEPSGESREGVFIPRRDTGSWPFRGRTYFPRRASPGRLRRHRRRVSHFHVHSRQRWAHVYPTHDSKIR